MYILFMNIKSRKVQIKLYIISEPFRLIYPEVVSLSTNAEKSPLPEDIFFLSYTLSV